MQERNKEKSTHEAANRGHGPQGIDKAPGEETAQDNVQFTQQTQKGKKVDRDPTQKSEEPLEDQDI